MDWVLSYEFYRRNKAVYITDELILHHNLGGTYRSGKGDEPDDVRTVKATEEAEVGMTEIFGKDWRRVVEEHNNNKMLELL